MSTTTNTTTNTTTDNALRATGRQRIASRSFHLAPRAALPFSLDVRMVDASDAPSRHVVVEDIGSDGYAVVCLDHAGAGARTWSERVVTCDRGTRRVIGSDVTLRAVHVYALLRAGFAVSSYVDADTMRRAYAIAAEQWRHESAGVYALDVVNDRATRWYFDTPSQRFIAAWRLLHPVSARDAVSHVVYVDGVDRVPGDDFITGADECVGVYVPTDR